jgi:large subunit ribosomal protein L10
LAFTKKQKQTILAQYDEWISKSQAVFMMEYNKVPSKQIDSIRAKLRENGAELHITKNTLLKIALEHHGIKIEGKLHGTTLCGFAFNDIPSVAKVFKDAAKDAEMYKIKGGYLATTPLSVKEVTTLADLPPLPVMRSMLLGVLNAPASKLVRTLAEPARQVAAVVKAYSEKEQVPA